MSVHRIERGEGSISWRVRWREGGRGSRARTKTFDRKADAIAFDDELRRRRRLGDLSLVGATRETLNAYVAETWAPMHMVTLAQSTAADYALLYDKHIAPYLGHYKLIELSPEIIGRWQAERIASGAGRTSVLKALTLLGAILQRAMESGRITRNPVRLVRKAARPRRREIRPLAPVTVEALRNVSSERDATVISVLAYAGLRPQEALALSWVHVRKRTILVERAVSLGDIDDTKTDAHRTVRLLKPLADDLERWRHQSRPRHESALVFPGVNGQPWTRAAYKDWTRKTARGRRKRDGERSGSGGPFGRAAIAAGVPAATPYALRHSFASLLLHEGRSVMYVARQLGHGAQLTLSTYGHVIDELDDAPRISAEDAISAARASSCVTGVSRRPADAA